jgi:hypothetical protein
MTEAEWLACKDPTAMLEFLRNSRKIGERKARLFAVACCRRIWQFFTDERSRRGVDIAEKFADGLASRKELVGANMLAYEVCEPFTKKAARASSLENAAACGFAASVTYHSARRAYENAANEATLAAQNRDAERAAQAALLRDIYGNLYRHVATDPAWLTSTVTALAQAIYADRAFDRLPILADALEDAGCSDADILAHCRGGGEHVRGCWVVDLLTGRE